MALPLVHGFLTSRVVFLLTFFSLTNVIASGGGGMKNVMMTRDSQSWQLDFNISHKWVSECVC